MLTHGLIAHYNLGEVATRHDLHSGLDLLPQGHIGALNFPGGNADYFDGASRRIRPHHPALWLPHDRPLTVSVWCMSEDWDGSYHILLNKDNGGSRREYSLYASVGDERFVWDVFHAGGVTSAHSAPGTLTAKNWLHVLAWCDPANNLTGIRVQSGDPVTATLMGMAQTDADFCLGASGAYTNHLHGYLRNVRLWSRLLDSSEQDAILSGE